MADEQRFPIEGPDLTLIKQNITQLFRAQLADMTPTQLHSSAALLFAIQRLPVTTPGLDLVIIISQPNTDGNYGWVKLTFSEQELQLG